MGNMSSSARYADAVTLAHDQVTEGMLVVRKIENVPMGASNRPKVPVVITGKLDTGGATHWQNVARCRTGTRRTCEHTKHRITPIASSKTAVCRAPLSIRRRELRER